MNIDSPANSQQELPFSEAIHQLAVRFLLDGHEKAAANLLLQCRLEDYERGNYDTGRWTDLVIRAKRQVYDVLKDSSHPLSGAVHNALYAVNPSFLPIHIQVEPDVKTVSASDWRDLFVEEIQKTDGPHNQAAEVWSSEIATWERLRFRSQTEIKIAITLDSVGVFFLPNCRGRVGPMNERKSVEADFVILYKGKLGILEVDGPTHGGAAAKDHRQDALFLHNGVSLVQRYEASRCYADPDGVVKEFLALLEKR